MLMLAIMALVPGALIYVVSVQFVTRSIESWFDVRVEQALEAGLNLGRDALEGVTVGLVSTTRDAALAIAQRDASQAPAVLAKLKQVTVPRPPRCCKCRATGLMCWLRRRRRAKCPYCPCPLRSLKPAKWRV